MIAILFVCLGNICRSPALEATLRTLAQKRDLTDQLTIDSCAMGPYFLESKADERMIQAAKKRGVTINTKAKLFLKEYFYGFDYIFGVDKQILEMLNCFSVSDQIRKKMRLATAFSAQYPNWDIPDPYGGGEAGFDQVMEMVEDACLGILNHLEKLL